MASSKKATVYVRLKEGVLDPQGTTIHKALHQMGYQDVLSVRTGRFFELELRADAADLDRTINEVCTTLLANPVIESFTVEKAG
ncbi:MAG TPA: phosphoribosylformylglycinamidine synthase subunit PurS [candidate division Zixibacteria bacterium]|nr:phosphoribosylformylglycinamidine synthase subunit PurS [candidate division Zixibacteria bacterium]MDD4917860.1 phosphoribosylformylglycinamidine synthase subunit PurS [candidate division Zixibacteria bacterium]MDM7973528.1 phosphoribosylformylglycinamidine synthase subunit PurS [candidate division Zixibacteria bacterium]HOD67394.1 phosphoribosylformylglycinamidine synthase subunit PurS [candidate division Zixibacteria bacterium]HOZ07059.1 phosphoribosylformylglycinamidine synthase subunit P